MTAKEANMQKYTKYAGLYVRRFSDFPSFIFKASVEKVVLDEEKLRDIEIDGILNLKYLSRTVFIN